MRTTSSLSKREIILIVSLLLNVFLLFLLTRFGEGLELSERELQVAEQRAVTAEVEGRSALLREEASGKKVYQMERLFVSERTAKEELEKRYQKESKQYKDLVRSLTIKLSAQVKGVEIVATDDPLRPPTDTMLVSLPKNISYADSTWFTLNGSIVKAGEGIALRIDSLNLNTGEVSVDDVSTKPKWYSFKKPASVVRISVESPYYSMLSAREFSVKPKKPNKTAMIVTHAAAFIGGAVLLKLSQQ
jgi:hypothetical protein